MDAKSADRSFAKIALQRKFVTQGQIDEAFEIREKMVRLGVYPKSLAEILMDRGILSQYLVKTIYRIQGDLEGVPKIPGYQVETKIGHGGMGTVYRARQVNLDRTVAIKVLEPSLARDRNFVSRFLREARSVAQLNHENIIVGIDVGKTSGDAYFFVMEYVEGDTVYDILNRENHFEEPAALEIALQIARALKHAADNNLVHRDIKPDNIMITPEGVAKLCDLGLAKSTRTNLRLTQAGSTHGTPHYMSPEQARGRDDIDIRSDIYSLGATLYHMLVGSVPFDGESAAIILLKHISEDLPSPRVRRPEITEHTCHVLERMMAKRREDRYQNPSELIEDLEQIIAGEPPTSKRPNPGASSIMRIPVDLGDGPAIPEGFRDEPTEPMSRSDLTGGGFMIPLVTLAGGILLVLIGAGLISGLHRQRQTDPPRPAPVDPEPQSPPSAESATTQEEAWARDHFGYSVAYAADHPEDVEGILTRYLTILEKYPGTLASFRAEKELLNVLQVVSDTLAVRVADTESACAALMGEKRFLEAALKAADLRAEYAYLEKLKAGLAERVSPYGRLVALEARIRKGSLAQADALKREAAILEREGDFTGAMAVLKALLELGISDEEAWAHDRIADLESRMNQNAAFREREREKAQRRRFLAFVDRFGQALAKQGFEKARELCHTTAAREELGPYRDRCGAYQVLVIEVEQIWSDARKGLLAQVEGNASVFYTLRSGKEVKGYPEKPDHRGRINMYYTAKRQDLSGTITMADLLPEKLLELAGLYAGSALSSKDRLRRGAMFLAEGDLDRACAEFEKAGEHADGREPLEPILLRALEDFRAARAEADAQTALDEAFAALDAADFEKARDVFQESSARHGNTLVYESNRMRIAKALARAQSVLARQANVQDLLAGQVKRLSEGRHRIAYGFKDLAEFEDWKTVRESSDGASWAPIGGGGMTGSRGRGIRWVARYGGAIDILLKLRVEKAGRYVEVLRLEYPEATYLFRLGLESGTHQVILINHPPDGEEVWTPLGNVETNLVEPGRDVRLRVQAGPGGISLTVGDKRVLDLPSGPSGTGRLSLWATPVSLSYFGVQIVCQLDPGWVLGD